ncbi:MAG: hypothetical protein NT169_25780 [Chloroflexi bacterium]|nr:hypothetical protein [Chloroflexota bacterium]
MKTVLLAGLLVLALVMLAGCVAGPNAQVDTPNEGGKIAGFWQGLWHGIIAPVTFVISLFSDKAHVFEVHNNGNWYTFGFLLGITAVWGGGGASSARRRR